MRLLIDTHFVIWLVHNPSELTTREAAVIADAAEVYVSAASTWELRTKWRARDREGNRKGLVDPVVAIEACTRFGFGFVGLKPEDSCVEISPAPLHGDPFDHMLLVHAQQLGARLLTRDGKLRDHPLALRA